MSSVVTRLKDCANGIGSFKTERGDFGLCEDAIDEIFSRDALIKELVAALDEIANIKERKKDCYPPDWRKQIAACPECQRYKGHPIQQGICDEHRKPIYAQEDHDRHETKILGYRSMDIARDALTRANEAGYGAQERNGDES